MRLPLSPALIPLLALSACTHTPDARPTAFQPTPPERFRAPSSLAPRAAALIAPAAAPTAILLRSRTIDTSQPQPAQPAASTPAAPRLMLLQFAAPPTPAQFTELANIPGLRIVTALPTNAYLVFVSTTPASAALTAAKNTKPEIRFLAPFLPSDALHPDLAALKDGEVAVTIQVVDHPGAPETLNLIRAAATRLNHDEYRVLTFRNIHIVLPAAQLAAIANRPDVVNIEPDPDKILLDERQGQILAAQLDPSGAQPVSPGYTDWLASLGFPPASGVVIDITDDGFDRGSRLAAGLHPDFLDAAGGSRIVYAVKVVGATLSKGTLAVRDCGGHGTLNAAIAAGYPASPRRAPSPTPTPALRDPDGYLFGLGIAPFARLGASRIFAPGWTFPDLGVLQDAAYRNGARISSNSWASSLGKGSYDALSQHFDALVRDAQPAAIPSGGRPGNQGMVILFAAGNSGPDPGTIGAVGATSKNTITVGASENFRPTGDPDGCGSGDSAADNARDIAPFSSRGPCADGRFKPDLVAPGTHIQGAASTAPCLDGSSICGGPNNDFLPPATDAYYPPGQKLYTWSSGTSHACPAVAGAAALVIDWFRLHSRPDPSPAMVKAILMNSAEYLTGEGTGGADKLPSNTQGMGRVNLGRAFDTADRALIDQSVRLTATGQTWQLVGGITNISRPTRITLAWTDAPASPIAAKALLNDLDLTVEVGGVSYRGNHFAGPLSTPGGEADTLNTVESVFLPPGVFGVVSITITASTLIADGVPNDGAPLDQDFALTAYNIVVPAAPDDQRAR